MPPQVLILFSASFQYSSADGAFMVCFQFGLSSLFALKNLKGWTAGGIYDMI